MTKWKNIQSTPYDTIVLFYTHEGNTTEGFFYDESVEEFSKRTGYTHWQPRPEPPKE